MTDARDVIAKVLRRYPFVADVDMPDELLRALAAAGLSITATPDPLLDLRDDNGYYLGKQGTVHEHRTVGSYRAWCYDAHEWCYPSDPCHLCKELADV